MSCSDSTSLIAKDLKSSFFCKSYNLDWRSPCADRRACWTFPDRDVAVLTFVLRTFALSENADHYRDSLGVVLAVMVAKPSQEMQLAHWIVHN